MLGEQARLPAIGGNDLDAKLTGALGAALMFMLRERLWMSKSCCSGGRALLIAVRP